MICLYIYRFLPGFAPFVDGTVIAPRADPIGSVTLPMGSAIVRYMKETIISILVFL